MIKALNSGEITEVFATSVTKMAASSAKIYKMGLMFSGYMAAFELRALS